MFYQSARIALSIFISFVAFGLILKASPAHAAPIDTLAYFSPDGQVQGFGSGAPMQNFWYYGHDIIQIKFCRADRYSRFYYDSDYIYLKYDGTNVQRYTFGQTNSDGYGKWMKRYWTPGWDNRIYVPNNPVYYYGTANDYTTISPSATMSNFPYTVWIGESGPTNNFGHGIDPNLPWFNMYYSYGDVSNNPYYEVTTFVKGLGEILYKEYNSNWQEQTSKRVEMYATSHNPCVSVPDFSLNCPNPYVPPSATCTPNCSGKACGDNGCGGSCGTCATGSCVNGSCTTSSNGSQSCTPNTWDPLNCRICGSSGNWGQSCSDWGTGGTTWCVCQKKCTGTSTCASSSSCTPDCGNKTCGDNGCGGSCGSCASGQSCSNGQCANQNENITTVHCQAPCPIKMTPGHYASFVCYDYKMVCSGIITCDGKQCTCDDADCPKICTPKTCSSLNYKCGSASDGCGVNLSCGGCLIGQTCTSGQCVSSAACVPKTCTSLGYNCSKSGDGCGNSLDCGNCSANQTCSNGVCVAGFTCVPKTCASSGYSCGKSGDSCGNTLDCGTCPTGQECINNACQASLTQTTDNTDNALASLYAQIEYLQSEIVRVTNLIKARNSSLGLSCASIGSNLSYGMKNDPQVKCLQEFLKSQGLLNASPTGNYYTLTKNAVAAFQLRYADELLVPYGLNRGSGNVGDSTRSKINQLLAGAK